MNDTIQEKKDFYMNLAEGTLTGSECHSCRAKLIPQRAICPRCQSSQLDAFQFSGKGSLVAYTVIRVPPTQMALAGYDYKNPYCVGIVELAEGPRVAAQILEVNLEEPEKIRIGTPLIMDTITRGQDVQKKTFLAFKPA
jgi:hypothetical protein